MKNLIKAFLSAIVLVWLVHLVSFSGLLSSLMKTSWVAFFCAWLMQTVLVPLQTERWRIIASRLGIQLRFFPSLQNVWIGQFFNQVFPSALGGDAVRVWRLHRASVPVRAAIFSVVLERVVALFSVPLIAIMGVGLLVHIVQPGPLRGGLIILMLGFGVGLLGLLSFDMVPLPAFVARFQIVQFFRTLSVCARQIFFSWNSISKTTFLSIVIQAGIGLSFWLLARGVGATNATLLDFLVLSPLVMLVTELARGIWTER